jgi:hypothetical protein
LYIATSQQQIPLDDEDIHKMLTLSKTEPVVQAKGAYFAERNVRRNIDE